MNEQRIQDLKDALVDLIRQVQFGEIPATPEVLEQLADVMDYVANRIQELRREEEESSADGLPPQPPGQPQLEPGPYPSSNINAFKYDPETQKLLVKFQGDYPQQNGPVYSYEGVPKYIYDIFSRGAVAPRTSGSNDWHTWKQGVTPSLGASMYALIRNGPYAYQRVS